jgi:hypothetical protein
VTRIGNDKNGFSNNFTRIVPQNNGFTSTKFVCPFVLLEMTLFTSASIFTLSLSVGGVEYHLDRRVLPCLF